MNEKHSYAELELFEDLRYDLEGQLYRQAKYVYNQCDNGLCNELAFLWNEIGEPLLDRGLIP